MSEANVKDSSEPAKTDTTKVFGRLTRMLRPHRGMIFVALALLLLSMPGELFPGMIWMYVVDHLIRHDDTIWTRGLHFLISFNGRLHSWQALLASATLFWLPGIYVLAEAFGTISSNIMNRVAQRFILEVRNRVYRKLQSQSLSYPSASAPAI